jgi:exopolyphosphatase/guanosine-5'-triphosphate,3'-diphosphate pyrophosphatase
MGDGNGAPRGRDPANTADAAARAPERSGDRAPRPDDGAAYAALDLGTNNCRMLVARPGAQPSVDGHPPANADFRVIDSFSRITRLGEGLSRSGVLSREAMDRTVDALKRCAEKMERRRVTASRQVATEACRRAANCDEFLDRVAREAGITLEIISAHEEATLALKGCAGLIDRSIPYAMIFDIGGGSTEVLLVRVDAHALAVEGCISLPMGVVTVAEDCGGGDLCTRTYGAVMERVTQLLRPFNAKYAIADKIATGLVQMIGTSGTVTTLGGLHLGLERYDRALVDGLTLDFSSLVDTNKALCRMTLPQRAAEPCIGWQRADLVLVGCAILDAIIKLWPVGKLRVADRGLREGLLMDLICPAALQVAPGPLHPL